jgi:hypothetical protein
MGKKKNVKPVVRIYPIMAQFIFHLRREFSVPVSSATIKKIAEYSGTDFENDENYGHPPLIVIDGKEITWKDFGQMLKAYEGFKFKLEIFDRSEDMP